MYLTFLVLTLAVQVLAVSNLKSPALAPVPARAHQAPSASDAHHTFQRTISIAAIRLGQRPTWDLPSSDLFNPTLGFPGEGPPRKADGTRPMEVDVQPALSSSPALILGSSPGNTAVSSGPAIDAAKEQKIANAVGMTAFGELWEAMNCSISGSRSDGFKLNFKCGCARNKQRISFRVPVDKPWTWADECPKLKTRVVELHCGEQCTPTLSAKARPQVKRPQEDNWLSEYADKSKKQKEEAAHRKAVAGTETLATTLVRCGGVLQRFVR